MPKGDEYGAAKYIVIMLCVAKIIDMATGLNNQIFSMSNKYKFLMVFLLIAVLLNVGLNLVLIPLYGVEGSAIATIISIVIYNFMKYVFLKVKFNLDPFSVKTLKIIGVAFVVLSIGLFLPKTGVPLVNIVLVCGTTFSIFFLAAYKFNLAPELNSFFNKQLTRFGIKPFD
jgi:O-antigen/teichoic acid export membrane protein